MNGLSQNKRPTQGKKSFWMDQTLPSQLAYLLYFPRTQLTVVVVRKGSASATPVTDFDSGQLGQSTDIPENHIWFSAPDFIKQSNPNYPWNDQRKSLPIDELTRLGQSFDFSDRVADIISPMKEAPEPTPPEPTPGTGTTNNPIPDPKPQNPIPSIP
jgi:hypothetical protein